MRRLLVILIFFSSLSLWMVGCGAKNTENPVISSDVDFDAKDYQKIVQQNNQLGFDILPVIKPNQDGNIFISPTSLYMALAMVYNGADGSTQEEISNVLRAGKMDNTQLNQANASWMNVLHRNSDKLQLNVANSIWLNEEYNFQEDFATKNEDYFNATIEEIDISNPDTINQINDWVNQSTNNKIDKIIQSPLDPDLVSILLNAIYFKGEWKYEFDKKESEVSTFYIDDEEEKDVRLMTLNEKLAYQENEYFQAVSLPYGDEEMSMKVFLPKKSTGLEGFTELLTHDNWEQWNSNFSKKEGTVILPSFQLDYEVTLKEALKKLGMESAFTKEANFTKMINENVPLWISDVKQKTFIEVNEEGTEAAAVTSVEVVTESASVDNPFYMRVDRPFYFAITDDKTDTILFMGSLTNPQ